MLGKDIKPLSSLLSLRAWSRIRPQSVRIVSAVTLIRAAIRSASNGRPLWSMLQEVAREELPTVLWATGTWSPERWQARPFVLELQEAASSFPASPRLAAA
eukprot:3101741-Pyramimonas_sp.AAC.1